MPSKTKTKKQKFIPNRDGSLFIVEGVDGSGKSTQMELVAHWLESNGFAVEMTEWNSSETIRPLVKQIKKNKIIVNPYVFSMLHAADLAERIKTIIEPALKAGKIVLADRYIYTAYTRDVARGLNRSWVEKLYSFAPEPDLAFYFQVTPEVAISRKLAMPKFYEAGMDIGLSKNPKEAFAMFQREVINGYEEIKNKYKFNVMDGTDKMYQTFPKVKKKIIQFIKNKYKIQLT